jgi:hypothetical protein
MAFTHQGDGSRLVSRFCNILQNTKEDIKLEVLATKFVGNIVTDSVSQTPEVVIFPSKQVTFR